MANVRFKVVETCAGIVKAIADRQEGRAHAFGTGVLYASFAGSHRDSYTREDAQNVCDWLNGRTRIYGL
jgi:hypothetical protein